MVPQSEGRALRELYKYAADHGEILTSSIKFDRKVQSVWSQLNRLGTKEAWPEDSKKRHKQYKKLSMKFHPDKSLGSSDRYEAVQLGYRASNYYHSPELQANFDFDVYMDSAYGRN